MSLSFSEEFVSLSGVKNDEISARVGKMKWAKCGGFILPKVEVNRRSTLD